MNPGAAHPEMPASGSSSPLVYVLGEAPGKDEDHHGVQFVGESGQYLRQMLPAERHLTAYDNVVRTRPPGNRDPTDTEIEAFRGVVSQTIAEAKPKAILALGRFAFHWGLNSTLTEGRPVRYSIKSGRGRRFPISVNGWNCWLYPTLHPSHVLRMQDEREDKIPGKEWKRFFEADLLRPYREVETLPDPRVVDRAEALRGCSSLHTLQEVAAHFDAMQAAPLKSLDYETQGLRPYAAGSALLSAAFSDGQTAFAFLLDHAAARWTPAEREWLRTRMRTFMVGSRITAHSAPFEMEWTAHEIGFEWVHQIRWECSLQAAYALGDLKKALSLDFQCRLKFGLGLKSMSKAGQFDNDLKDRMAEADPVDLLEYDAMDTLWCHRLFCALSEDLEADGRQESYGRQQARMYPAVHAQWVGVPTNVETTRGFKARFDGELASLRTAIARTPEVQEFLYQYRSFDPASQDDPKRLYKDFLQRPEGKRGAKYSTDADALKALAPSFESARLLLEWRALDKLRGTYVEKFLPEHPETVIYPDGLLHCSWNIARTASTRLASSGPNNQNWPSRRWKEIRKQLEAPPGWVWVALDQGQIEARTLACLSKDPVWIRMLKENYDVHQEWAEKVARAYPAVMHQHDGKMKALRSAIKNQLVFPAFFGAAAASIAGYIGIPVAVAEHLFEEFWELFAGIKRYQQQQWALYQETGKLEVPTNRVRLGPLSFNMVCNDAAQNLASDIVVDVWVRLYWRAIQEDKPWLAPVLNIHDDLTLLVPRKHAEEALNVGIHEMLAFRASWLNVPLQVEAAMGPNLYEMKEIGKYTSVAV